MPNFSRLIRFTARDGRTYYGDAILPNGTSDVGNSIQARVIRGSPWSSYTITDQIVDVRQLLSPIALDDIRTVRCIGLNYAQHAHESNLPIPSYPVLFYKPATSVSGPYDAIPVPPIALEAEGLDFECELVAVIGREAREVSESSALDYVVGYCVGNDVSHREWQLKRSGGQWSTGKGFDGWAPIGPGIVSSKVITDPQNLKIWTKVNGTTVQESNTADMIFSVAKTIAFLSRGTTLLPGDLIFTGTPQGVGMGRKPQLWLKPGDIVEVGLEGIGSCVNKVEIVQPKSKL